MEKLKWDAQTLLGIRLSTRQVEALERYEKELISWNERFNLTAIREPESIRIKHFLDSLSCLLALREAPPSRLVDVGTGAGFPGLPLKIVIPTIRLTLVESVGKKAEFCRHMVDVLGLEGVDVLHARAEEIGQMRGQRGLYDWATARAVASLPVLLEYLLPLVRIGGRVLAQKGESGPTEVQASERALHILGGQVHQLIPVHLPGVAEDRYLVVINKIAATPDHYPRRPGTPSRNPLV
jgi:16S rRNA (guanine527-N7)-methyltransferase